MRDKEKKSKKVKRRRSEHNGLQERAVSNECVTISSKRQMKEELMESIH